MTHPHSLFVTLTYDDEHLPSSSSLHPFHTVDWMKRLRRALAPKRVRFYLVGEYGEKTDRPHYHLALFNAAAQDIQTIQETWGKGFTHCGDLTTQSAAYLCGYILKTMTRYDDPRLEGRHPEFARMSNRPGIAAKAMEIVGEHLFSKHGKAELHRLGDVPGFLKHGRKTDPLGPYLKTQLRNYVGMPDEFRSLALYTYSVELQALLQAHEGPAHHTIQDALITANTTRRLSQIALHKIYKKDRPL